MTKAKLLLQLLCRKKLSWDASVEDSERVQWKRWVLDLPKLKRVKVNRCFKPEGFSEVKVVELHVYSDSSRVGYAAVAYLQFVNVNRKIHCALVMGKARLPPIRKISILRLELSAAVVSVKLRVLVQRELDMNIQHLYHWTDLTSVLKCIHNESKRFPTFESNRLTIILNESSREEWRYVNTDANPADDGSKSMKMEDFLKNDRWLTGPTFLWKEQCRWPKMIDVPEMKDGDPELRKELQVYAMVSAQHVMDQLIEYHSSWSKLNRAVAWLLKYKNWLIHGSKETSNRITVANLQCAEREILRHVRRRGHSIYRLNSLATGPSRNDPNLDYNFMGPLGVHIFGYIRAIYMKIPPFDSR